MSKDTIFNHKKSLSTWGYRSNPTHHHIVDKHPRLQLDSIDYHWNITHPKLFLFDTFSNRFYS